MMGLQNNRPALKMRRWVWPIVGATVAMAALFTLYRGLDLALFLKELRFANLYWIVVLGASILFEQLIQGWKWRQLLFAIKPIASLRLTAAFLAGYGANALVPLGISPLVRSWLVARLEDLRMASVLVTTVISRFVDGIVFALIAAGVAIVGKIPTVEGDIRTGLAVAGALNLLLFSLALGLLLRAGPMLERENPLICRLIDWLANKNSRLTGLRDGLRQGIIWPRDLNRQLNIVGASVLMKAVAATNFLWAGLAVGIRLTISDYLFLMVFAGFSLVLSRFIRLPGGFIVGSAFALSIVGVADEKALAMILFSHITALTLVVGIGLGVLWRSGVTIREMKKETAP